MISNDLKVGMWLIDNIRDSESTIYKVLSLNREENKIKLEMYEMHSGPKGSALILLVANLKYNSFAFIEPMLLRDKRDFIKKIFNVIVVSTL